MTKPLIMSRLREPMYVADALSQLTDYSYPAKLSILTAAKSLLCDFDQAISEHLCANCRQPREDDEDTMCFACRDEFDRVGAEMLETAQDDEAHAAAERAREAAE